jgi:hypothetical protein
MKSQEILPVIVSIGVIILVAVLQRYSKTVAAVTATMPVNIPLSIWIIYASSGGDHSTMTNYADGLVAGIIPTVAFVVAVWFAARLGFHLASTILFGYATWTVVLLAVIGLKRLLGLG